MTGFPALNSGLKDPIIPEDILPRKSKNPKQHSLQGQPANFSTEMAQRSLLMS
jgi:hypothetical protein